MRLFDVQGIEITATREKIFDFVRRASNLPRWAHAFVSADDNRARLETPAGAVEVALEVKAEQAAGTVDWRLEFPDGSVGTGSVARNGDDAWDLHLQLRPARAAGGARADRGRA